jgi:hypothetical protein
MAARVLVVGLRSEGSFLVIATDTAHRHVETWMRAHMTAATRVSISDVTGAMAQINVQGPRSREVMQAATSADMSDGAFAFRAAREVDIGFARLLCARITYVGELGYELFVPVEQAVHVYSPPPLRLRACALLSCFSPSHSCCARFLLRTHAITHMDHLHGSAPSTIAGSGCRH